MSQQNDAAEFDMREEVAGFSAVAIQRYKDHVLSDSIDFVAREVPVSLVFNGISQAVMLTTPQDLTDFAIGFSYSEGIIGQRSEVFDIEQIDHPGVGIEIHLTIASSCFARLKERRRSTAGRTGCGLCGLESLTAFEAGLETGGAAAAQDFMMAQSALFDAFRTLQQAQPVNAKTGSMHAAAWVNARGQVLMVREDLGRHNALDKLIGALLAGNVAMANGCVIMTSRASYELAQKAARAQIPLLATISAPTSLAIEVAERNGLTLIGFVRNASLVAYSHAGRISWD